MRHPHPRHLKALQADLDRLHALTHRRPDSAGRATLPGNLTRLAEAIDRDNRGGIATPDGWPTGSGDGTGSTSNTISDPTGTAGCQRATGTAGDPIHARTVDAVSALRHAIDALDRLDSALDWLDAQLELDDQVDVVECENHRRADLHAGGDIVYGDLGGRLPRAERLCQDCYRFAMDVANGKRRPAADGGLLPTIEQVRHHHATGRWVLRGDLRTTTTNPTPAGDDQVGTGGAFTWRTPA